MLPRTVISKAADELDVVFLASGRRYVVKIILKGSCEADSFGDRCLDADYTNDEIIIEFIVLRIALNALPDPRGGAELVLKAFDHAKGCVVVIHVAEAFINEAATDLARERGVCFLDEIITNTGADGCLLYTSRCV